MNLFFITSASALVLSLIAKYLVDAFLHTRLAVIGSFAGLSPMHNSGVAFGVQLPPVFQELLIFAALVFVCVLAWKTHRRPPGYGGQAPKTTVTSIGYGLIVGGALGNVLDRLPDGLVTDFIQIGSFAVFNVADSCITIGVLFLLADVFGLVRNR